MDIWSGVTDDSLTHSQTLKDRTTQLLIKYKSGALVTQKVVLFDLFWLKRRLSVPLDNLSSALTVFWTEV